jgi:hypothetical protein
MELLIAQLFSASYYFSPPRYKYFSKHPVLEHLQFVFSL